MNRLINPGCIEALGLTNEQRVLDMGSGTGLFSLEMANRLNRNALVVGVEYDAEQLRPARQLRGVVNQPVLTVR